MKVRAMGRPKGAAAFIKISSKRWPTGAGALCLDLRSAPSTPSEAPSPSRWRSRLAKSWIFAWKRTVFGPGPHGDTGLLTPFHWGTAEEQGGLFFAGDPGFRSVGLGLFRTRSPTASCSLVRTNGQVYQQVTYQRSDGDTALK